MNTNEEMEQFSNEWERIRSALYIQDWTWTPDAGADMRDRKQMGEWHCHFFSTGNITPPDIVRFVSQMDSNSPVTAFAEGDRLVIKGMKSAIENMMGVENLNWKTRIGGKKGTAEPAFEPAEKRRWYEDKQTKEPTAYCLGPSHARVLINQLEELHGIVGAVHHRSYSMPAGEEVAGKVVVNKVTVPLSQRKKLEAAFGEKTPLIAAADYELVSHVQVKPLKIAGKPTLPADTISKAETQAVSPRPENTTAQSLVKSYNWYREKYPSGGELPGVEAYCASKEEARKLSNACKAAIQWSMHSAGAQPTSKKSQAAICLATSAPDMEEGKITYFVRVPEPYEDFLKAVLKEKNKEIIGEYTLSSVKSRRPGSQDLGFGSR